MKRTVGGRSSLVQHIGPHSSSVACCICAIYRGGFFGLDGVVGKTEVLACQCYF